MGEGHKDGKEMCCQGSGKVERSIGPRYIVYMYEIVKEYILKFYITTRYLIKYRPNQSDGQVSEPLPAELPCFLDSVSQVPLNGLPNFPSTHP